MYNLLVRGAGWSGGRDSMGLDRVFEHTDSQVAARFRAQNVPVFRDLIALPALFMEESAGDSDPAAYVGTISRVDPGGRDVVLTSRAHCGFQLLGPPARIRLTLPVPASNCKRLTSSPLIM